MDKCFYYSVARQSELGLQLEELMKEIQKSEAAADAFAMKHHSEEYIPDRYADYGGVDGLIIQPEYRQFFSPNDWEIVQYNSSDEEIYIPKLVIKSEWIKKEEVKDFLKKQRKPKNVFVVQKPDRGYCKAVIMEGTKKAVEVYKEMLQLPVIEAGTLNRIVQVPTGSLRCAIRQDAQNFYIIAPVPSTHEALVPCQKEDVPEIENTEADA